MAEDFSAELAAASAEADSAAEAAALEEAVPPEAGKILIQSKVTKEL